MREKKIGAKKNSYVAYGFNLAEVANLHILSVGNEEVNPHCIYILHIYRPLAISRNAESILCENKINYI